MSVRVVAERSTLTTAPGGEVEVALDVVNTSSLIDGVTARVVGLDPRQVTSRPPMLPLFPEASGRLSLLIGVPRTFPAGRHPLTVELSSSVDSAARELVDLDLVVDPEPRVKLEVEPAVRRAYRRGRYHVLCHNPGNVPITTTLAVTDAEKALRHHVADAVLTIEPNASASTLLTLRARRKLFGNELDRAATITATDTEHGISDSATVRLRQRPTIPRGLLTVGILLVILGMWAGAFLLGLTKVFSGDPLTKSAPASFFVASKNAALSASITPAGVLPKSGALPAGEGAGIAGTVNAASTKSGIGRIVVEALRPSPRGLVLAASAATQSDGSYVLLGLLPGSYYLRYSAVGYVTTWYPSVTSESKAKTVSAAAQALASNVNETIAGLPASISGSVDPGNTLTHVVTTVTAVPLSSVGVASIKPVKTDANGNYTLAGLPAPGHYELSFQAAGYATSTLVDDVDGGEARSEPTVRLSAGNGSIAGVVLSGTTGLGGVTVTTSQDGQTYTTGTPTIGAVGHFSLTDLPTPGTYVVTLTKPGYGADTLVVDLSPGQQRSNLSVHLAAGTGTVSGTLTDSGGTPLGGATVTVGGTTTPVSTTTLTDGAVGTYAVSGLPTPGTYTLTFAAPGYSPVTVPVNLAATQPTATASAALTLATGAAHGTVLGCTDVACTSPSGIVGATVTATNGATTFTLVTVDGAGAARGTYEFAKLPPGSYTVTVTAAKFRQETALLHISAAGDQCQDFVLRLATDTTSAPAPVPGTCA